MAFPVQSWSEEKKVCFKPEEAKKILAEIKYGQTTFEALQVCQEQISKQKEVIAIDQEHIKGLEADKKVLTEVSDTFKEKFIETNKQLMDCTESKPSRVTWFAVGVGAGLLLSIASALLISK